MVAHSMMPESHLGAGLLQENKLQSFLSQCTGGKEDPLEQDETLALLHATIVTIYYIDTIKYIAIDLWIFSFHRSTAVQEIHYSSEYITSDTLWSSP